MSDEDDFEYGCGYEYDHKIVDNICTECGAEFFDDDPGYGWPEIFPREPNKLVSKAEQEAYPWIFQCGTPKCYWRTAHKTKEHAQQTKEKHTCGQENRKMAKPDSNHSVPLGASIIEKIWAHLDEATKIVMESVAKKKSDPTEWSDSSERTFNEARGNARGLSVAIFEMSVPGYATADEVAKHAVARYKAIAAGEELPPTVGINNYNPHLDAARAKVKASTPAKPAPTSEGTATSNGPAIRNKHGKVLSEADLTAIKHGIGAGLPDASLAGVYKITVEDVVKIKASMGS